MISKLRQVSNVPFTTELDVNSQASFSILNHSSNFKKSFIVISSEHTIPLYSQTSSAIVTDQME